jgi:hypothetical protein
MKKRSTPDSRRDASQRRVLLPLLPTEAEGGSEVEPSLPRTNNRRLNCFYLRCPARLFRSAVLMRRHCERCGRVFSSITT